MNPQVVPLRLLLVDDSEDEQWLLDDELRQAGFEPTILRVDEAAPMAAALREGQWDLLLVDYVMPRFSAPEAFEVYQQSGLDIPFIIISAQVEESIAVAMMEQGVHDFIAKGNRTRLLPAIRRELAMAERRRRQRESERRYALLYQGAEVSIWEEDFSEVWRILQTLREQGVEDLKSHLLINAEDLYRLAGAIRILDVNPATLRLLEASDLSQLQRSIEEVFTADSFPVLVDELCAIWNGDEIFQAEAPHRTFGGRHITVILSMPVPHSYEEAKRVPVSLLDITEQKQAEERNNVLARQNQLILDTAGEGVFGLDCHGMHTFVNPAAARMLGWSVEELLAQPSHTTWHHTRPDGSHYPEHDCPIYSVLREGEPCRGEEHFIRHDGTLLEVEFHATPILEAGEVRGAVVTFNDITERKRAEMHLNRVNRMLATLSQCNQALVRSHSEKELLASLCDNLIEYGGYALAWVALVDEEGRLELRRWARTEAAAGDSWQAFLDGWRGCVEQLPALHAHDNATLDGSIEQCRVAFSEVHAEWEQRVLPLYDGEGLFGLLGVFSARAEPFDDDEMELLLELAADLSFGFRSLRTRLERDHALQALDEALLQTISAISLILEKRDPYTAGHQQRVAHLAERIGRELGYDEERLRGLRIGALLHDIGKIAIPAEILSRPGKLSSIEYRLIQEHPVVGDEILRDVQFPWPINRMIREHHECLDGSGYPDGISAESILHESRILAVSDVIEAMTSHRPYRPALGVEEALHAVREGAEQGRYDPEVVAVCERLLSELGKDALGLRAEP